MTDLLARLSSALADRYTIERELGQGGMATVYLARDLRHERPRDEDCHREMDFESLRGYAPFDELLRPKG